PRILEASRARPVRRIPHRRRRARAGVPGRRVTIVIDASWDPTFTLRSDVFSTIADAARSFERCKVFPTPEAIDEALARAAGVRFVRMKPVARRRRAVVVAAENMYDARIVQEGIVPTRAGSWHDFLNALVWATFPRAKK